MPFSERYFNSLPHAEVDEKLEIISGHHRVFQLTTSRRVRRNATITLLPLDKFQLTTSRRGRRFLFLTTKTAVFYFNSLPHAEVDGRYHADTQRQWHFNSLPHAEVDSNLSQNLWTLTIDSITNRIINLCFLL